MNNSVADHMPNSDGSPKTFTHLIHEIQDEGRCTQCGGCVSFCAAVNYGALGLDAQGRPGYADRKKCIECGHCYMICPARDPLEDRIRKFVDWRAPVGRMMDVSVACASDNDLRQRGTDGGVITALLLHLLDTGHIDGAVVTLKRGFFQRRPHLATTREEIIAAAGSSFASGSDIVPGNRYSTYSSSIQAFRPLLASRLRRIAFVGVPCQIKTLRNMQALGIIPADTVHIALGLFCSGSYDFNETQRKKLEEIGGFRWKDTVGMIIRNSALNISLKEGTTVRIALDQLPEMRRSACSYCQDYCAEFADLSFGGVGAPESWTSVMVRTPVGRAAFTDAMGIAVKEYRIEDNPHFAKEALQQVQAQSDQKKVMAQDAGHKQPKAVNYGRA